MQVPVVLVLDKADVVRGPAMVSLLRQLRAGFQHRGAGRFPVSLTLRNFHAEEVRELLAQHTEETGQRWSDEAVQRVWERPQGQPFLVNALADRAVTWLVPDRTKAVGVDAIEEAEQHLIMSRTTHLDNLSERLKEPRVASVLQPVLLGDEPIDIDAMSDDLLYVQDLGLVRTGDEGLEVANPICREVLVRQLSQTQQLSLPDGRLNVTELVRAFLAWWRENADILWHDKRTPYLEAAAHLAFMGSLQRVIHGGGRVVVRDGIAQLSGYLDTLGLTEGWLLVFEPRAEVPWETKLWTREEQHGGKVLHLRGG